MKVKKFLLFIYLCFASNFVHSEENIKFHPPALSPDETLQFIEWHLKKEKINYDKYKLTTLTYSYGARKWIIKYTLFSDDNKLLSKFLKIYMSDEYPCAYDIDLDQVPRPSDR